MCDQQRLRPACSYAQTDQSLCLSLKYSMRVKLLTELHLEFLSMKGAAQARLSLHMSKCRIVANHMYRKSYHPSSIRLFACSLIDFCLKKNVNFLKAGIFIGFTGI